MMGGGVEVSSEVGKGSTFSIFVPKQSEEENVDEETDIENPELKEGDEYILLVDDDKATHDVVKRAIRKEGHTVYSAFDGDEGVDQARKFKPKLILLDVLMPGRDGWQATTQAKEDPELKDIPIIALTAHALETDRQKALAAGADDFDTKPVDIKRLLEKIGKFI